MIVSVNKLTKYNRIKLLSKYGLNTPYYTLIKRGCDTSKVNNLLPSFPYLSVRTQSPKAGSDLNLPKYVNMSRSNAFEKVKYLVNEFDVLVSEAISPDFCIKCGNIALLRTEIIIEVVYGAGTLDRLTRQGQVEASWFLNYQNFKEKLKDKEILQILKRVTKIPIRDIIIEFSIFSKEVGCLNEKYIAWEIINY